MTGGALRPVPSSIASPPTVSWPAAQSVVPPVAMDCPNCGGGGAKPLVLTVHFATPDHPLRHSPVLRCPACRCLFYENQSPPDYTDGAMLGRGRVAFYLQQGAGLSLITRPLARLAKPPGSVYLEVGCGFGFGLDFAIRARGWKGGGIDPGQIAGIGAALLDVPIEQRYLGASEPAWDGNCDVVMASETIEHVPSPAGFIRILRRALRPDGILVLTTPNGAAVHAGTSPGALVPLLSPGLHLVFQTQESLECLLAGAGFPHVLVEIDGASLVAYASDAPITLEADAGRLRAAYRDYLEARAAVAPRGGDLFLAYAGRLAQEAVNDSDMARADRALAMLGAACRDRFGFDLDGLDQLPAEVASCPLERLAEVIPLSLGGILLADAVRRLAAGAPRPSVAARFRLAADAADALRRALGDLAMEDGMSETIGWTARAEALLCDAASGAPDVATRLHELPPSPAGAADTARAAIGARALVQAVNAGHLALGAEIAASPAPETTACGGPDGLSRIWRDALFCRAVLDLRGPAPDPSRAAGRFAAVVRDVVAADTGGTDIALAWQAARGWYAALDDAWDAAGAGALLDALRLLAPRNSCPDDVAALADPLACRLLVGWVNGAAYEAARTIAPFVACRLDGQGAAVLSPSWRDAAFCLGVLELQPGGDVARARGLLARVRAQMAPTEEGEDIPPLFWASLRGEMQAIARIDGEAAAGAHLADILPCGAAETAPADLHPRRACDAGP